MTKTMCRAVTRKGTPCTRSASYLVDGYLPVCAVHAEPHWVGSPHVVDLPEGWTPGNKK